MAAKKHDEVRTAVLAALEEYHERYCQDCSQEGRERHRRHHAAIDSFLDFMARWTNAKWKVGIGVAVMVTGALTMMMVAWFLLHALGMDIRKWKF